MNVADWWRRTERIRSVFLVLIVIGVLWEIAVRAFGIRTFILPAPSLVIQEFFEAPAFYAKHSVFTLGTTAVHVAGPFYEAAAGACRMLDRRGMLLTGQADYAPRPLPAGVQAFTYAPYSHVLPRGCATVHHGGIGTAADALRAGVPQWLFPSAHDQADNAQRLVDLGVGRRFDIDTPVSVLAAAAMTLAWPGLQDAVRTIQARMAAEPDGIEQLADWVMADARTEPSSGPGFGCVPPPTADRAHQPPRPMGSVSAAAMARRSFR